jgi:hypothetical protein
MHIPPRHLKSLCASIAFPAWCLAHDPSAAVANRRDRRSNVGGRVIPRHSVQSLKAPLLGSRRGATCGLELCAPSSRGEHRGRTTARSSGSDQPVVPTAPGPNRVVEPRFYHILIFEELRMKACEAKAQTRDQEFCVKASLPDRPVLRLEPQYGRLR